MTSSDQFLTGFFPSGHVAKSVIATTYVLHDQYDQLIRKASPCARAGREFSEMTGQLVKPVMVQCQ